MGAGIDIAIRAVLGSERRTCAACGCMYPPDLVVGDACQNCKGAMPVADQAERWECLLCGSPTSKLGECPGCGRLVGRIRRREPTPSPRATFPAIQVNCDRDGCPSYADVGHAVTEPTLNTALRALGWDVTIGQQRTYHHCPRCRT
jgi:hypothetical protein